MSEEKKEEIIIIEDEPEVLGNEPALKRLRVQIPALRFLSSPAEK